MLRIYIVYICFVYVIHMTLENIVSHFCNYLSYVHSVLPEAHVCPGLVFVLFWNQKTILIYPIFKHFLSMKFMYNVLYTFLLTISILVSIVFFKPVCIETFFQGKLWLDDNTDWKCNNLLLCLYFKYFVLG